MVELITTLAESKDGLVLLLFLGLAFLVSVTVVLKSAFENTAFIIRGHGPVEPHCHACAELEHQLDAAERGVFTYKEHK